MFAPASHLEPNIRPRERRTILCNGGLAAGLGCGNGVAWPDAGVCLGRVKQTVAFAGPNLDIRDAFMQPRLCIRTGLCFAFLVARLALAVAFKGLMHVMHVSRTAPLHIMVLFRWAVAVCRYPKHVNDICTIRNEVPIFERCSAGNNKLPAICAVHSWLSGIKRACAPLLQGAPSQFKPGRDALCA